MGEVKGGSNLSWSDKNCQLSFRFMVKLKITQVISGSGDSPGHNEDGEQEVELVRLKQPGPVPVQDAPEHAAVTHRQVNSEMENIIFCCLSFEDE